MKTRYHMSATKSYLIHAIENNGAGEVLTNWKGTNEEAIQVIRQHKNEVFPIGQCDNLGIDGSCQGHRN